MNQIKYYQTTSPKDTEGLAYRIGELLKGGEIIELVGDLGSGKTTFVRGLAHGSGSVNKVASPSFTIKKIYKSPKFEIYHYDFYRLNETGILAHELEEALRNPHAVVVIEWGDIARDQLPDTRLQIIFKSNSDEERELTFRYPKELCYLIKD